MHLATCFDKYALCCMPLWWGLERFAAQVVHWHHAPMMNAYSKDLRKKIVQAPRRGTTKSEAARSFGVSRSSVKRYAKLAEEGRPLAPKRRPGSRPKMDESARRLLEADMEERPAATLSERCEYLGRVASLSLSESTVSRMLRRLGWSRKKIAGSLRARRVPKSLFGK